MKKHILKVWMILAISFLAMDVVGQSYSSGFPNVSNVTHESAILNLQGDYFGTTYWILSEFDAGYDISYVRTNGADITYYQNSSVNLTLLSPSTSYFLYLITDGMSPVGTVEVDNPTVIQFTTQAAPTPLTATLNPLDNAPDISVNTSSFVLTFSEAIKYNSTGTYFIRLYESGNSTHLAERYINQGDPQTGLLIDPLNNTLSIDFGYQLDYSKEYYITIPADAIWSDNLTSVAYAGLAANDWSFTTEAEPFEITTKSPTDGTTDVSLTQSLVATFNQNIQFAAGGASVSIFSYSDDVLFETLTDGAGLSITGMDLTINPTTDFAEGTRYYVTIPAAAIETTTGTPFSGVILKDDWDFTTVSLPLDPPTLSPIDGDTGVSRNAILEVIFNKDIEFGSGGTVEIFNGTTQEKLFNQSSSNISIVNNNTLRIDLSGNSLIEYATLYDVRISSDFIKRVGSEVYFAGFTAGQWSFTTAAQPLELTLKSPLDGETGVSLTQSLVATFNQNIQLATGAEVYLRTYDGDALVETLTALNGLSVLGMDLTMNPTADFEEGTRYYVVIPAGAIETTTGTPFAGITLKDDWDFTSENLAPTVVTYDPDGLTAVAVDKVLNLTFDRPIKFNESGIHTIRIGRNSDASTFYTYYINGLDTDELLSVSGNVLSIIPPVNFESSTQYYVEISDGAILSLADMSFPGISGTTTWTFTSVVAAAPPVIASGGYSPATGAFEVSRNPILELTFNENIVKGNSGYFKIYTSVDNEEVIAIPRTNAQVSILDNKLTVSLSNITLEYGTEYYILIDAGFVKSSATGVDFGGIELTTEWSFTTESSPPFWVDGYPSITNQTMNDFVFNAWADVEGTYYGVVTQSSTPPTAEQISQGMNQGGTSARIAFNDVVSDVSMASTQTVLFTSETPLGGTYYLHAVYSNGSKFSAIETLTIDRIVPQILFVDPSDGLIVFPVDSPLSVSFNEPVVGSDGNALTAAYFSLEKDGEPVEVVNFGFVVETVSEITSVTLTPALALDQNAAYTLTINPVYDLNGNVSVATIVNFQTDGVSTWTGASSSDWTVAANWLGNSYVPFKSVVIQSGSTLYPEITTGTVDVHNLTIEPGAALTQTGGILNVTGEFHLLSSSEVNASYLTKGGSLVMGDYNNVFVHQSIPVPNDEWIFLMGSPTLSANAVNSGSGFHMREYNNSTDTWSSIGFNNMVPGVGYSVYSNNDLTLRGEINRFSVIANLTRTDGMGFGWNVLGNPFTSSIKWSDVIDHIDNLGVLDVIENNYWVWNPSQNIYNAFNQEAGIGIDLDGTIPSNHGFLVKVAIGQSGGQLVLVPEAQVMNTNNYLKSASTIPDFVKLRADGGDYYDKLAIAFIDVATEGLDKYDTEKRLGSGVNPFEIFSVSGSTNLTINSSPYYTNKEVPLGFNARKVGTYSFGIDDSNIEGVDILLLDKLTGDVTNLQGSEDYSFEVHTTGRNTSRFSLRFVGAITTKDALPVFEDKETSSLEVFVNEYKIFVGVSESLVGSTYQVHDLSGRLLQSDVFINSGIQGIGQFSKGIYLLSVKAKGGVPMNQKIVVY